jgi:hypothetical protein
MITERDDQQEQRDDRATLAWSLLVSGFANLMLWMLLAWVIALRTQGMVVVQNQPTEVFTVTSSSLNIAKRTQPVPAQPQHQPKPEHAPQQATPKSQAQPTKLARVTPNGTPQPRSAPKKQAQGTLAETLAQQEVAFQHEAQQINAQHSVISVATIDPNHAPSAQQPFQRDISGLPGEPQRGEGIIFPNPMTRVHGEDCYNGGRYALRYDNGELEHGEIPWLFCFTPGQDPFLQRYRRFEMPVPVAGYRLPSGVELQPAAKDVYNGWLSQQ